MTPHAKKLDNRSIPMLFIGYEPESKTYRVYNPITRKLQITRDVVFEEYKPWKWDEATEAKSTEHRDTFTVLYENVDVVDKEAESPH